MFSCDPNGLMTQQCAGFGSEWTLPYLQYPGGYQGWGEQPWQPWSSVGMGQETALNQQRLDQEKQNSEMFQASTTSIGSVQAYNMVDRVNQHVKQPNHFNPLNVSVQSGDNPCTVSPNAQEVPSTPSPVSSETSTQMNETPNLPSTQYNQMNYDNTSAYYEMDKTRRESQSSLYSFDSAYSSESGQSYQMEQPYAYPISTSPPSSPESEDSVFGSSQSDANSNTAGPPVKFELPPINLKNNQSFTEAEIKAITPWRNQLIERLLNNRSINQSSQPQFKPVYNPMEQNSKPQSLPNTIAPNQNLFVPQKLPTRLTMYHRPAAPKTGKHGRCLKPGTKIFHDVGHIMEFDFGEGSDFDGKIKRGSTGFMAISGAMTQVCDHFQTIVFICIRQVL